MTQQSAVPSPSVMPLFKKPVIADIHPAEDAKTYTVDHPQVVKAKHLTPGMEVQPFVHGKPRGSVRVVENVSKADEDGAEWYVEFSTPHPAANFKAAYRFWDVNPDEPEPTVYEIPAVDPDTLDPAEIFGPVLQVGEPAKPTKKNKRPAPPEHLTYQPFAHLKEIL